MSRRSYGSVSIVKQGSFQFFSLTMPSDVLAGSCYVVNRQDDPAEGFQRVLNQTRAKKIAEYIDHGLGVIPSSIVLSAQKDSGLEYSSRAKTLSFEMNEKVFLIIDGQHRVFGFRMAEKILRVPVIIFDGLSKKDETRLFIDINSTQRGVSSELLLDIKRMAEYESESESFLFDVFDTFNEDPTSILIGRLSPSKKIAGKLTRATFNSALTPITKVFGQKSSFEVFEVLNSYLRAFDEAVLVRMDLQERLFNTNVFKAICNFMPKVAKEVKRRFGPIYSVDNFHAIVSEAKPNISAIQIEKPGGGYKKLLKHFEKAIDKEFTL